MSRPRVISSAPSQISERVESKIVDASELPTNRRFLIYGKAKAGKTRLASSAPDVLLVDVNEKGTESVRRNMNPKVYPVETWSEINDLYWYLAEGKHNFRSVALDGITAMQTLCMNFVLGEAVALDASRDPDMPTRQVWGKVTQLMKTQITNYRNLPMNVVFTALTRRNILGEDEGEAESSVGPACSPSVSAHLEQAVDVIGYIYKREVMVKVRGTDSKKPRTKTRLIVEGTDRFLVGDRTHTLGNFVEAPDLMDILTTMDGKEAE
jgi:AAA domain